MKQVYCTKDFVEDGIDYWNKGSYYNVRGYDKNNGGLILENNYGTGMIYDEDFDEYFEEVKGEEA